MNYKLIEGHEKYIIFKTGKIYSKYSNKFLKPSCDNTGGYLRFRLNDKLIYLHRLLAIAFIDNPDNKPLIDHIDRNKLNNNLDNLRWVTSSENCENRGLNKNNKLKQKNISENINKGYEYYILTIKRNGNKYQKRFRKNKYSLEDVVEYRDEFLGE